jgi:hypothetical protein
MDVMKDKDRRFQRKRDEVYVDFPAQPDVMDWEVQNVSVGGFRVRGTVRGEPGSELECVLTFPAAGVDIPAKARVVWSEGGRPPTLGLVFAELEPGDRLKLAHALYQKRRLKAA